MSADYNTCDSCHRELPDNVKYYHPKGARTEKTTTKTEQLIVANQDKLGQALLLAQQTMDKNKFYGSKHQIVLQQSGAVMGNPVRKVAARASLKRKHTEPGNEARLAFIVFLAGGGYILDRSHLQYESYC